MKPIVLFATLATIALAGCKEKKSTDNDPSPKPGGASLSSILLEAAPENAITITEARKNPTPGTRVVVSGKVMGNENPIVESRAMLVLGDPTKLTSCDLKPEDFCEMPWDVCCDPQELITASIATIQILDEAGKPRKSTLRGLGGLKELSSLVVVGEVADGSNENNFLINATGIHVAMAEPTKENPAKTP